MMVGGNNLAFAVSSPWLSPWGGGSARSVETEGFFRTVRAVRGRRAPPPPPAAAVPLPIAGDGEETGGRASPLAARPLCPPLTFVSLEIAMRPDVEAMKADIEQSVALLRRRL